MVGLQGCGVFWAFTEESNDRFCCILSSTGWFEYISHKENSSIAKASYSITTMPGRIQVWWLARSCCSLDGKYWPILLTHRTLPHQNIICFVLCKMTWMVGLSILMRPSKSISSSSSLEKSSLSTSAESCNFQKDGKRSSSKVANTLLIELCYIINKWVLKITQKYVMTFPTT